MSIPAPKLKEWKNIYGANAEPVEYIHLSLPYRASCALRPDGTINLITREGGGHGDPGGSLGPIPLHRLRALIDEAEHVGRHYWGDDWGSGL